MQRAAVPFLDHTRKSNENTESSDEYMCTILYIWEKYPWASYNHPKPAEKLMKSGEIALTPLLNNHRTCRIGRMESIWYGYRSVGVSIAVAISVPYTLTIYQNQYTQKAQLKQKLRFTRDIIELCECSRCSKCDAHYSANVRPPNFLGFNPYTQTIQYALNVYRKANQKTCALANNICI